MTDRLHEEAAIAAGGPPKTKGLHFFTFVFLIRNSDSAEYVSLLATGEVWAEA